MIGLTVLIGVTHGAVANDVIATTDKKWNAVKKALPRWWKRHLVAAARPLGRPAFQSERSILVQANHTLMRSLVKRLVVHQVPILAFPDR